jgi:hypothetical protein
VNERLCIIKVVGAVTRHTVGYANQFGTGRRFVTSLPVEYIKKYANIKDQRAACDAVSASEKCGYVVCVERGRFHHSRNERKPSSYGLRWLMQAKRSNNGSKNPPADQFKKTTSRKTRLVLSKQQQEMYVVDVAAVENAKGFQLLIDEGFDENTANCLAALRSESEIAVQIAWIDLRNPRENRLGMLRKAIEQQWAEPDAAKKQQAHGAERQRAGEWDREQEAKQDAADRDKQRWQNERIVLLQQWHSLPRTEQALHHERTIEQAPSEAARRRLQRHKNLDTPAPETLKTMALATASLSS